MMYHYNVRPGYRSQKNLIEFRESADNQGFMQALRHVLDDAHMKTVGTEDLWMNDEIIDHMNGRGGPCELSVDTWGNVFSLAEEHQAGIAYLAQQLTKSHAFEQEEVDPSEHAEVVVS